jgi:hypothetical protein
MIQPGDDLEAAGLNFVEAGLVRKFRAEHRFAQSVVYGFQISVNSPLPDQDDFVFGFGFGFALIAEKKIVCFRIQDHLRKMGLARLAIRELTEAGQASGVWPEQELPESLRDLWTAVDYRDFTRLFESARASIPEKAAANA